MQRCRCVMHPAIFISSFEDREGAAIYKVIQNFSGNGVMFVLSPE
jgi:hypothetical protein